MAEPLPATVKLTLYRGDTRIWSDVIEENTGTETAPVWTPKDLTGHTFLCQIRADKNRGEVIATIDVAATDAAAGRITRTLTAEEADKLPGEVEGQGAPRLFWDLQITRTGDGFRRTYMAGPVVVKGDASDD